MHARAYVSATGREMYVSLKVVPYVQGYFLQTSLPPIVRQLIQTSSVKRCSSKVTQRDLGVSDSCSLCLHHYRCLLLKKQRMSGSMSHSMHRRDTCSPVFSCGFSSRVAFACPCSASLPVSRSFRFHRQRNLFTDK